MNMGVCGVSAKCSGRCCTCFGWGVDEVGREKTGEIGGGSVARGGQTLGGRARGSRRLSTSSTARTGAVIAPLKRWAGDSRPPAAVSPTHRAPLVPLPAELLCIL